MGGGPHRINRKMPMAENTQEKRAGVKATRWPLTAKIQPFFGSPSQKINTHPRKVDCNQISGKCLCFSARGDTSCYYAVMVMSSGILALLFLTRFLSTIMSMQHRDLKNSNERITTVKVHFEINAIS